MYLLIDLESFVEFAIVPIFEVKRLNAGKSFEGFKSFQIFVDLKNSFFIVECRLVSRKFLFHLDGVPSEILPHFNLKRFFTLRKTFYGI